MIKKENGITVITLAIVIIIILIITGMLLYSARDSVNIRNLTNMQNDISNLRDKISSYYSQYGEIPASTEYRNTGDLGDAIGANDTGRFLIIELNKLDGLTLNYGRDYEKIRTEEVTTQEDINKLKDIYIINEHSHNIFYVAGVGVKNNNGENTQIIMHYTDYMAGDAEKVEMRVVDGVTIPNGFYYVGGTKEEGIVISDNAEDANKGTSHEVAQTLIGNQFVWVPVENDDEFKTYEGYYGGSLDSYLDDCAEPYTNGYANEESEYNAMKESVLKYNGFYVGRYEAGTSSSTPRISVSGTTDSVVVKQGANVYNWIGWSDSDDMTDEKGGAVEKSKDFASDHKYTSVTSTLIYGVQWDAIMQWIDNGYKNEDGTLTSFVANSDGKGNYSEDLARTGSNASYAVKNIYDLAGNVYEWTMESFNSVYRVNRGRLL